MVSQNKLSKKNYEGILHRYKKEHTCLALRIFSRPSDDIPAPEQDTKIKSVSCPPCINSITITSCSHLK
jgi:hypothetical protein